MEFKNGFCTVKTYYVSIVNDAHRISIFKEHIIIHDIHEPNSHVKIESQIFRKYCKRQV